jgi:hypothetical protein
MCFAMLSPYIDEGKRKCGLFNIKFSFSQKLKEEYWIIFYYMSKEVI